MNKALLKSIKRATAPTVNKAIVKVKKYSPEILTGGAIILGTTAVVTACIQTTKLEPIIEECNTKRSAIAAKYPNEEDFEAKKRDIMMNYIVTAAKITKLYSVPTSLLIGSAACALGSHKIMKERNLAIASSYEVLNAAFRTYRNRVIDKYGQEIDEELYFDVHEEEYEETVTDKKGKEKTVTKKKKVVGDILQDPYAKCFDDKSLRWSKDPQINRFTLQQAERWANEILRSRGHLFLNEVYDSLDIPRTMTGATDGWMFDLNDPTLQNYVSFGLDDIASESVRDFINGYEASVWLRFNCDGPIYQYL